MYSFFSFHHIRLTYPNSDKAVQGLASLTVSQSGRWSDPREPSRVISTTTTAALPMSCETAKAICQHFMDARLIENAANPSSNLFKDCSLIALTPKGLHVLERFISRSGIISDRLQQVFVSQPTSIKLFVPERRSTDDEIIITQSVVIALFRFFVGRQPNYPSNADDSPDLSEVHHKRSQGVILAVVNEKGANRSQITHYHCFQATPALEWLCDFTSVVSREEATEIATQFIRFDLIAPLRNGSEFATVRSSTPAGTSVYVSYRSDILSFLLFFISHCVAREIFMEAQSCLQDY
jgi:GTPase-activating protein SST2